MEDLEIYKENNSLYNFLIMQQERIEKLETILVDYEKQKSKIENLETIVHELQNSRSSIIWHITGLSIEDIQTFISKICINHQEHNKYFIATMKYNEKSPEIYIEFNDYKNELFVKTMLSINKKVKILPTRFWPMGNEWQDFRKLLI